MLFYLLSVHILGRQCIELFTINADYVLKDNFNFILNLSFSNWYQYRWNAQFKLSYRLILREKELHLNIAVYNRDPQIPFSFNLLLHTYFKCPDVRRCQVTGLNGCTFIDKTREPPNTYQECRDVVVIGEWTDRIYASTPAEHIITNVVSGMY